MEINQEFALTQVLAVRRQTAQVILIATTEGSAFKLRSLIAIIARQGGQGQLVNFPV